MPPYAYLDQRAVINLGRRRPAAEEDEVHQQIEDRTLYLLLSPAHWADTAGGTSDENSRRLAEFIDGLRPFWLLERIGLHRLEIRSFLEGRTFAETKELAICRTVTEVVANLHGVVAGGAALVDTPALVAELRRRGGRGRRALQAAYSMNERAFQANFRHVRAGRLTPELERHMQIVYLRRIGQVRPRSEEDLRLQDVPAAAIRSIVTEWEVTKENWRLGGHMTPRRFHDLQHLTASLPYADILLTHDGQMRRIANAIRDDVEFPIAPVVGSMGELLEFVARWDGP